MTAITPQHAYEYKPIPPRTMAHALARTRGFLLVADVDLIMKWVERHKPTTVVDLGAGSGTTSCAVLLANKNPHIEVHTYDISEPALHTTWQFLYNQKLDSVWVGHLVDSVQAAQQWEDGSVDMLLLDTSHEYEPTVRELAAWRTKLAPDGIVWIHDYFGKYQGVAQAVDEALLRGELDTIECAGWSWLGRFVQDDEVERAFMRHQVDR